MRCSAFSCGGPLDPDDAVDLDGYPAHRACREVEEERRTARRALIAARGLRTDVVGAGTRTTEYVPSLLSLDWESRT